MNKFLFWGTSALTLALIFGGTWFYQIQEIQLQYHVEDELATIANLKARQISEWRDRRLDAGYKLMRRPLLVAEIIQWLTNPKDANRDNILNEFRILQEYDDYLNILLVTPDGHVRLSLLQDAERMLSPEVTELVIQAFEKQKPILVDLHIDQPNTIPHISTIVPIFAKIEQGQIPSAAILLKSDVYKFLYPLIQSWPIPSETAETLIVRREQEDVLFLNPLRHYENAALKLRIPINQQEIPAVIAVLGKEGIAEGQDYRNVEVIAYLKSIPDSPWFMVAKVDKAEAFAFWKFPSILILCLLLSLIALLCMIALMIWQRHQKAHYQALCKMEAARRKSDADLRSVFTAMSEGVVMVSSDGKFVAANAAAAHLFGLQNEAELIGKNCSYWKILRINGKVCAQEDQPIAITLATGKPCRKIIQQVIRNDGVAIWLEVNSEPIFDPDNSLSIAAVASFNDITERVHAEEALRKSQQQLEHYLRIVESMIFVLDTDLKVAMINRKGCDILGYRQEEIIGKNWFDHFVPESTREQRRAYCQRVFAGQEELIRYLERSILTKNGEERCLAWHNNLLKDDTGKIIGMISSCEDITQRKRAEKERESLQAQLLQAQKNGIHW